MLSPALGSSLKLDATQIATALDSAARGNTGPLRQARKHAERALKTLQQLLEELPRDPS